MASNGMFDGAEKEKRREKRGTRLQLFPIESMLCHAMIRACLRRLCGVFSVIGLSYTRCKTKCVTSKARSLFPLSGITRVCFVMLRYSACLDQAVALPDLQTVCETPPYEGPDQLKLDPDHGEPLIPDDSLCVKVWNGKEAEETKDDSQSKGKGRKAPTRRPSGRKLEGGIRNGGKHTTESTRSPASVRTQQNSPRQRMQGWGLSRSSPPNKHASVPLRCHVPPPPFEPPKHQFLGIGRAGPANLPAKSPRPVQRAWFKKDKELLKSLLDLDFDMIQIQVLWRS